MVAYSLTIRRGLAGLLGCCLVVCMVYAYLRVERPLMPALVQAALSPTYLLLSFARAPRHRVNKSHAALGLLGLPLAWGMHCYCHRFHADWWVLMLVVLGVVLFLTFVLLHFPFKYAVLFGIAWVVVFACAFFRVLWLMPFLTFGSAFLTRRGENLPRHVALVRDLLSHALVVLVAVLASGYFESDELVPVKYWRSLTETDKEQMCRGAIAPIVSFSLTCLPPLVGLGVAEL